MLPKVSLGVPSYGGVEGVWSAQFTQMVAALTKTVDVCEVIDVSTMTADHARNLIADSFLKSSAEWLMWVDSDTLVPAGAVERMLSHGKTMVSGLYYGKNPPHPPIAYTKYNGAYRPIDQDIRWEKGEIIHVDTAGMGCCLTHRSVYEDIKNAFVPLQVPGGGIVTVHKSDIMGDIETASGPRSDEMDGKVYKGQLRLRLRTPDLANLRFPFFMIDHLRTEDIYFFELAERVGHKLYLDTSIECGHLRPIPYTGADYRNERGH